MGDLTVYVYYKIPAENRNSLLLAIKKLDQKIKLHYPYLTVQHQKKTCFDAQNRETWMETYAGIAQEELEKFTAHLSDLAEKNGLPIDRRYEIFSAM